MPEIIDFSDNPDSLIIGLSNAVRFYGTKNPLGLLRGWQVYANKSEYPNDYALAFTKPDLTLNDASRLRDYLINHGRLQPKLVVIDVFDARRQQQAKEWCVLLDVTGLDFNNLSRLLMSYANEVKPS